MGRDPYSWTELRLPENDLADLVIAFASPLIDRLGPAPALDDARAAVEQAVTFWNASVLAEKHWPRPRPKALSTLKKQMREASREEAALFDLLKKRWREHWLDPRMVETWTYEPDAKGVPRFTCTFELPERVRAQVPPPAEKRIAIGGKFLDEVRISLDASTTLSFPVDRHRGVVNADGSATVRAMAPSALQLFADGTLPPIGGAPVEVVGGGRALGPMVLASLAASGEQYNTATLVFRPATSA